MGRRQTALVTGASYGIGYELARLLAADGYDLVLVARGEERLARAAAELGGRALALDLARADAPRELSERLRADGTSVDVLVNNAGFGNFGMFAETDLAQELEMLQLNVVALTHLTKLFLPPMLERRSGRILNVASTAGFQPGPLMAVYFASKAYVISFSEALAEELRGTGVRLTVLCPGSTKTGFQKRAYAGDAERAARGGEMDAREVALAGYRGLSAGRTLVVPGLKNRLMAGAVRLAPRGLTTRLVRKMQEGT